MNEKAQTEHIPPLDRHVIRSSEAGDTVLARIVDHATDSKPCSGWFQGEQSESQNLLPGALGSQTALLLCDVAKRGRARDR